ncbi:MAG TPA: hypothetical protein VMH41_09390, partial [Mycobacteriales bacterium]|nr:hypothetical protein [Mycobacteriales bacterium]
MRGRTKLATRGARAIAAGGALAVVASVAGVALAQAPALAGTNAGTSYEYDCTTSLQAGEVAPFEVVANLTAAPDPALNSGGPFGATGALTFPVPGSEAAGFYSYGITSTGLNVSGLVIGSPDGTATGTYTYQHDFASQAITPTTVTGVSWDGSTATLTATAGTFSADEVGDGVSSTTAGLP